MDTPREALIKAAIARNLPPDDIGAKRRILAPYQSVVDTDQAAVDAADTSDVNRYYILEKALEASKLALASAEHDLDRICNHQPKRPS